MLLVPPRRSDPELLDLPGGAVEYSELCGSLSDIRRVNRFLGGTGSIVKTFSRMVEDARRRGEIKDRITLLDVAAGSADVPAALVEWGKSRGIGIKVTAVDVNEYVVRHAREWTDGKGAFDFVAADALALPFKERSFDFVLCSLTLHHFREDEARGLLLGIARTARVGYLVDDLRRHLVPFFLIYLITRLLTGNRLTRCDGPLSVLKAYTREELSRLARSAGLSDFRTLRHRWWRMALVGGGGPFGR